MWLLGTPGPSIDDLAAIAFATNAEEAQDRLHELIDWRVQRVMAVAKGAAGSAASFATALLLSTFKQELQIDPALLAAALACSLLIASIGIYLLRQLASLTTHYAAMLVLLRVLR
jgi:hypothetical protein